MSTETENGDRLAWFEREANDYRRDRYARVIQAGNLMLDLIAMVRDARQALSDRDVRIRELQAWVRKRMYRQTQPWNSASGYYCIECNWHDPHKPDCSVPRLLAESSEPANEH